MAGDVGERQVFPHRKAAERRMAAKQRFDRIADFNVESIHLCTPVFVLFMDYNAKMHPRVDHGEGGMPALTGHYDHARHAARARSAKGHGALYFPEEEGNS